MLDKETGLLIDDAPMGSLLQDMFGGKGEPEDEFSSTTGPEEARAFRIKWKFGERAYPGELPETVGMGKTIELSETLQDRLMLDTRDVPITDVVSLVRALRRTQTYPEITAHVERDPQKLHGVPIIKDTRIPVKNVLASLADSYDISKIKEDYPDLTVDQVDSAVYFAIEMCDL